MKRFCGYPDKVYDGSMQCKLYNALIAIKVAR